MTELFDLMTERRGTACYKWDSETVDYPLWVADMDFRVAEPIVKALQKRVEHGIFGYVALPDSFYDSVIRWHERRHKAHYEREWIITVPGVVPAVSAILRAMASTRANVLENECRNAIAEKQMPGVLLLAPDYNCFYSSIRNMGCRAEESVLVREGDTFVIDFDDLERRAAKPEVSVMILCSPHNPCGRLWTREELLKIADICLKNNVFVIVDEIHCELTMPFLDENGVKKEFVSYGTLPEKYLQNCAICTSASKSFNIAGLQNAQIIVPNVENRARIDRAVNIHEVCDVNPMGVVATEAAYNYGEEWLDTLCIYIHENYNAAEQYIKEKMPMLKVCRMEATYLMWVDISALGINSEEFCIRLKAEQSVWFASGSHYGTGGEGFVRINLATQRSRLMEALALTAEFIKELKNSNN